MNQSFRPTVIFSIAMLAILTLISCGERNTKENDCAEFQPKTYPLESENQNFAREVSDYHSRLLGKFNQSSLKDVKHDAYHLLFYSSHGYGKSIRFSKKNEVFQLSMKCIGDEGWNDECEEYQNTIDEEEWQELEKMIYEYDFWTAQHFRSNQDVLDGYILILEGVRTGAAICNIDTYKLVARGSPRYDKIGDLCHSIIDYEQRLRMRYAHRIR